MYWIKEDKAIWNENKARIIGSNIGSFFLDFPVQSDILPGEWFNLTDENGEIVGYGWINVSEGDAEISVAIDGKYQGRGYGSQIIDNLYREVESLGFEEIIVVVRQENPNASDVVKWAYKNGYVAEWPGLNGLEDLRLEAASGLVKRTNITLKKRIL